MSEENFKKETVEDIDSAAELELLKKVEAVLFISGKFMTIQELVANTDINPILLRQVLEKLEERYNNDFAINIVRKSDLWKMDVSGEFAGLVNKLASGKSEFSSAEQETLAVIAYKQPVKQSVIIKIRGNKAYDHIKQFTQLGLLRAKKIGHTKELSLSEDFYDYFHLNKED